MLIEVSIGGIYVAPFMVYVCAAVPIFLVIRTIITLLALDRWFWHPALFEVSLALVIVALLVLYL